MGWRALNEQIIGCDKCPRLRDHCADVARVKRKAYQDEEYWGRPVPNFGPRSAKLLIVGLAPGAHGANRTGRMFTGDRSGDWLYRALHKAGFASQAESTSADDGLRLRNCTITAACHCAPPCNKPSRDELDACADWFRATIELTRPNVMVALGQIAWQCIYRFAKQQGWHSGSRPKFGHAAEHWLRPNLLVIGSYHPSQQNTFTGKLTESMLDAVFHRARQVMDK